MTQSPATRRADHTARPVRVMLVDDSAVIRGLVARWLEAGGGIEVAASVSNGRQAVERIAHAKPDVVVLDIEMPELDGLSALPLLLKAWPAAKIVMASTLTRRNAEASIRALSLGAADYVAKPESVRGADAAETFRRELVDKVRALGGARPAVEPAAIVPFARTDAVKPAAMRPRSSVPPGVLLIGCSTGGPQALFTLFKTIGRALTVPAIVVQHMPATFTAILAEHIGRASGLPCAEGIDGTALQPGRVHVAPGGKHMVLRPRAGGGAEIGLEDGPPVNYCKPAVDPMFRSAAAIYGPRVLAAVLTGMGHDGREGARAIAETGGSVLAQDEASSVVWGMPGAVAQAGLAAMIAPLPELAREITKSLAGARP